MSNNDRKDTQLLNSWHPVYSFCSSMFTAVYQHTVSCYSVSLERPANPEPLTSYDIFAPRKLCLNIIWLPTSHADSWLWIKTSGWKASLVHQGIISQSLPTQSLVCFPVFTMQTWHSCSFDLKSNSALRIKLLVHQLKRSALGCSCQASDNQAYQKFIRTQEPTLVRP